MNKTILLSLALNSLVVSACQSPPSREESAAAAGTPAESSRQAASAERPEENPGWEKKEALSIAPLAFKATEEQFESHANYLSLPTPFKPVQSLFKELQSREGVKLKSRNEAHVTVITPPEFKVLSDAGVNMGEIEKVAAEMRMEQSDLDPVCLGMGQAMLGSKLQRTYFIVVRSENLLKIRRQVESLASQKVGRSVQFEADHFYPHITVGFTKDDLHENQGVIKGKNSCRYPIQVKL